MKIGSVKFIQQFREIGPQWDLTLSQCQVLDSSKLKEFTDDNNKFDENGIKLYKWVENTEGKGEIAQCSQKTCPADP